MLFISEADSSRYRPEPPWDPSVNPPEPEGNSTSVSQGGHHPVNPGGLPTRIYSQIFREEEGVGSQWSSRPGDRFSHQDCPGSIGQAEQCAAQKGCSSLEWTPFLSGLSEGCLAVEMRNGRHGLGWRKRMANPCHPGSCTVSAGQSLKGALPQGPAPTLPLHQSPVVWSWLGQPGTCWGHPTGSTALAVAPAALVPQQLRQRRLCGDTSHTLL